MRKENDHLLIDVVDDDNRVVGVTQRKNLLKDGLNFRVAHLLLTTDHGELVLQKLSNAHTRNAGLWGSSAAGFVLSGETPSEAIKRIIEKELRKTISSDMVTETWMQDQYSKKFISIFCASLDGKLNPDANQINSMVSVSPERLRKLIEEKPSEFTETFFHVFSAYSEVAGV